MNENIDPKLQQSYDAACETFENIMDVLIRSNDRQECLEHFVDFLDTVFHGVTQGNPASEGDQALDYLANAELELKK